MSLMSLVIDESKNLTGENLVRARAPIAGIITGDTRGFKRKVEQGHVFMEGGNPQGTPFIFCHGIFGSYRNIAEIGEALFSDYRVIIPCMPMYDAPLNQCTVEDLSQYLEKFVNDFNLKNIVLVGNSMGGGAVLLYAIRNSHNVKKLILFASSGLSFIPMRGGAMKLKNFEYVKELLGDIFYEKKAFNNDEFKEVFDVLQNKSTLLRILSFTRSTKRNFLHQELSKLDIPALVIWGKQDTVTPPFIAEEFRVHLKNSQVQYIDNCGHVPCYEKPQECLAHILPFLDQKTTNTR